MLLQAIHHVAIICSDYPVSRKFYTQVLGLEIAAEHYREDRKSWKLDLTLNGQYVVELFSFPDAPRRPSRPEACGMRHLAFKVGDIEQAIARLHSLGVPTEAVRVDEYTGRKFTFFQDPDNLPLELYEV
jgi:glyoxylase I family protein